jgi:hypothetical protein
MLNLIKDLSSKASLNASFKVLKNEILTNCFFHNDDTPSFYLNKNTGLYFCHACGVKGNIYSLVKHVLKTEKFIDIANYINSFIPNFFEIKPVNHDKPRVFNFFSILSQDNLLENPYLNKKFKKEELLKINFDNLPIFVVKNLPYEPFYYKNTRIQKDSLIIKIDEDSFQHIFLNEDKFEKRFIGSPSQHVEFTSFEDKPTFICEGVATALTFNLIGYNSVFAISKNLLIKNARNYYGKHKQYVVSADYDAYDELTGVFDALGIYTITFKDPEGSNLKYDANDMLHYDLQRLKNEIKHKMEDFLSKNFFEKILKSQKIKTYVLPNGKYVVCQGDLQPSIISRGDLEVYLMRVIGVPIYILQKSKAIAKKLLRDVCEEFVLNQTERIDGFGYNPNYDFNSKYEFKDKILLNSYKKSGLEIFPKLNQKIEKDKFPTIFSLINHTTENNFFFFSNFLANKLVNPEQKPPLLFLFYSPDLQGAGKSCLNLVLKAIFGNNLRDIDPLSLKKEWNDQFFNCKIWIMEEVDSSVQFLQRTKNLATSKEAPVVARNKSVEVRENYANGIIFSDKSQPVILEKNENRRIVAFKISKKIDLESSNKIINMDESIKKEIYYYYQYLLQYNFSEITEGITTKGKEELSLGSSNYNDDLINMFFESVLFVNDSEIKFNFRENGFFCFDESELTKYRIMNKIRMNNKEFVDILNLRFKEEGLTPLFFEKQKEKKGNSLLLIKKITNFNLNGEVL